MASNDAFALKNAGFNAFLFSEVGVEANGSNLTILSILARLGKDPWAEAAKWAGLPRPAAIERLTQSMAQMPLCPQALLDARATASRLFMLLPAPSGTPAVTVPAGAKKFLPIALLYAALAFGLLLNMVNSARHGADPVTAPTAQTDKIIPGS